MQIGSGYPSDNKTIEMIKRNLKTGILDGNIREKWSTHGADKADEAHKLLIFIVSLQ